jgi:hypothetical protein
LHFDGVLAVYKQTINDIAELFTQGVNSIREYANEFLDDPLLEVDHHDINSKDYDQLTKDKMVFVDNSSAEQLSFTTWLPLANKIDLENNNAFPMTQDGKYQAQSISVMKEYGLVVDGINRWFQVLPPSWTEVQHLLPDGFVLSGRDAFNFWEDYWEQFIVSRAEIFILAIRRNPEFLSYIREEEPYLLDYPGIQQELVEAFRQNRITEPKSTPGQKHQITQNIFELYHFVYFYRFQGMTLEYACGKAINNQGHLVPDDWSDPDEALRKRITRMDKYPRISINTAFKTRKITKGQNNQ